MSNAQYDYILLGAGTSGCYLAERLSREKSISVLVIDAGCLSRNPVFSMPAGFTQTLFNDTYNWRFRSEPQQQLNNREIYCPRGKVVGGSSMINGMIHSIGQREDYDSWVESGFTLGSSQTVMTKFDELFPEGDGITRAEPHALESVFLTACKESGLSQNNEKLHESQSYRSAGVYYHTSKNGHRYCVRKIIPLLQKRSNVTFLTNTLIDKLSYSGDKVSTIHALKQSKLARNKKAFDISVTGEVILCLGAIGSPAVLQRSGIGPKAKLNSLGIDSVIDLPVGENLQDHLLVKKTYQLHDISTYNSDAAITALPKTLFDYARHRKGPIAAGASSTGAFVSTDGAERPNTQIFFSYGSAIENGDSIAVHPYDGITIGSYQLRPNSRGSVTIRSTAPLEPPSIDYNYLADENDWQVTREGLAFIESLMSAPAFSAFKPKAEITDLSHDNYIRQYAETAHHPVGTCAVGKNGVLEGNLKVKGINNLSVADGSIIPTIISGNTQAICAVIGDLMGENRLTRSTHV